VPAVASHFRDISHHPLHDRWIGEVELLAIDHVEIVQHDFES